MFKWFRKAEPVSIAQADAIPLPSPEGRRRQKKFDGGKKFIAVYMDTVLREQVREAARRANTTNSALVAKIVSAAFAQPAQVSNDRPDWMKVRDAADATGYTIQNIYHLVRKERIPAIEKDGVTFVNVPSLLAWKAGAAA